MIHKNTKCRSGRMQGDKPFQGNPRPKPRLARCRVAAALTSPGRSGPPLRQEMNGGTEVASTDNG